MKRNLEKHYIIWILLEFLIFLINLRAVGTKAPASQLKEKIVSDYRESERQNMHKILDEYVRFCLQMGV